MLNFSRQQSLIIIITMGITKIQTRIATTEVN